MQNINQDIEKTCRQNNYFQSVLIITYGRSGSTLLQGILNSIPGYLIRGENNNFIFGLYQAYKRIITSKQYGLTHPTPQDPWYGFDEFNIQTLCQDFTDIIKRQIMGNKTNEDYQVYGFKEIRYYNLISDELENYLDFLKLVFPKPAFIFNFRNLDEIAESGFWKTKQKEEVIKTLNAFEQKCFNYIHKNKDICFVNFYRDLIDLKSDQARKLFDFLGQEYDEDKFRKVLDLKHSSSTKKHFSEIENVIYEIQRKHFSVHGLTNYQVNKVTKGEEVLAEGVILMQPEYQISEIFLIDSNDVKSQGSYGLKSPVMEQKFPENHYSSFCRYRVSIKSENYPMKLMIAVGDEHRLIHLVTLLN
ncbi:Sulfotransferase family protein [Planktothrix rubescens]|nr:Sulfotransferase family protein [Planktothrix rubescens]